MKIKTYRLAFAIAVTGLLGGCATVGPWDSQEVAQLKASDARMVAGDVVEVLVTEYAPGQTTFALSNGKPGSFGMALESQLRETGYAVAVDGEEKPIHALSLAYVLDELGQPGTYRVGVRVQPTYRMERLYQIDSAGQLVRGSGVTVRDGSGRNPSGVKAPINATPTRKGVAAAMPRPAFPAMPSTAERVSLDDYNTPDMETGWSVQVLAGANLNDLERNQARLERLGRESHIVKLGTLGRLQALRVGPFGSAEEARPVLREMRADRYADAFLVEPKRGGGQ
ncbi:SPOR domain-containing protein [Escherichia coli]|nr:SPOR domain-containing protein [Escherichia coli]